MKNKLQNCLVIFFFLISYTLFAQVNCDALKKENEYLRNALKVSEPILIENVDKTEIKLIKVQGDIKSQSIKFTFLLTNHAANKNVSLNNPMAIDVEGNQYDTNYEYFKIGLKGYESQIFTEVPIKAEATMKKCLPSIKLIKLFKFEYRSDVQYDLVTIEFKDINVDWK